MYAYAVDGLERDQRDLFDRHLNQPAGPAGEDSREKAREQRRAQQELMAAFGAARAG